MGSRRNTELMLLIGAAFPVTLLYALYVVTTGAALSFNILPSFRLMKPLSFFCNK